MIAKMSTPDSLSGVRTHTSRPGRSPPRNAAGEIFCQHSDCEGKKVTFRRPCEYNKHMDRHERPYKCTNPACEQNPGFTYSGGLLRHQREVHKMHLSKDPLYCPHSNCVRSNGAGFTRRENLEEHLRRRHSAATYDTSAAATRMAAKLSSSTSPQIHIEPLPPNRKRFRQLSSESDYELGENVMEYLSPITPQDHHQQQQQQPQQQHLETSQQHQQHHQHHQQHVIAIKRLKMEITRRDQVILQQAQELDRLRNLLHSLPQPLLYQNHSSLPGAATGTNPGTSTVAGSDPG